MLEIAGPKFFQNLLSIEIQLALFVLVVLLCIVLVLHLRDMDLLRATQQKRFYHNFETTVKSPTLKMLQAATLTLDQGPVLAMPDSPPLSSQPSTSSQRSSSETSQVLMPGFDANNIVSLSSSVAKEFINKTKHRTCEQCKKHETTLKEAKASLHSLPNYSEWSESIAKDMLSDYETFIDNMLQGHERLQIENEVVRLHVKNLTTAFNTLQAKFDKAKKTIAGLQRNEQYLLAQLSKYETMFLLISDANKQYQEREMQKEARQIVSDNENKKSSRKDKQIDTLTLAEE